MKKEKLNGFLGKKVKITFYDDDVITGILEYTKEFEFRYKYRRPGYYNVGNTCFRASHVTKIEIIN